MSITPFLSGLPVAVPTDPGSMSDGSDTSGRPGDPGPAFGEALAAALLVAPAPAPVESGLAPVESGLAPLESSVAPVESWVAAVESGLASVDLPSTPVESGVVPLEPAAPSADLPTPIGTTEGEPAAASTPAPGQLDHVAAVRRTGDVTVVPSPAQPDPTTPGTASHNSTGTSRDSSGTTHDSSGTTPDSTVTTHDSTGVVGSSTGVSGKSAVAILPPTVERAVVQQVFPEVTRFVATTPTDRPGTHRITLTLQPEQLGEVRVTLIVKDGAVQVRLAGNADDAAGNAAVHRALSSGATELQRLLERGGATEARVLVRDPSTTDTGQQGQSPQGWTSGDSGRSGAREQWSGQPGQPGHPAYRTASSDAGPGAGSGADARTDQRAIPRVTPLTARSTGLLDRTI